MTAFVARQAILDRSGRTCAYELLYRGGIETAFDSTEPDRATVKVIDASFFVMGLEALTGGQPAYVNFTADALVEGYAALLPHERLVVEVSDEVVPDARALHACRTLREAGYSIALDNVTSPKIPRVLAELASVVKVDFHATDRTARQRIARALRGLGVKLLASNVETEVEVAEARVHGYQMFQGFFFARPTIVPGREVPALKQNMLRLLREAYEPDPDHRLIEDIIRHDVALAFKLLVHMRAAARATSRPVDSVRGALLLLGDSGLRAWASILAVATLGHDRPSELMVMTLVRASFCEGILSAQGRDDLADDGFLMGLFSTIDAFLELPLPEALDRLALAHAVRGALLGADNCLRPVLDLALAYERGHWSSVASLAVAMGLDGDVLTSRYAAAVEFGNTISQARLAAVR